MFTCTGRFNGCIEGKKICLVGNFIDNIDYLAYLAGAVSKGLHKGRSFIDRHGDLFYFFY